MTDALDARSSDPVAPAGVASREARDHGTSVADGALRSTEGLRGMVARGVGWKLIGQLTAQATSVALGVLLAHLLTPREFGLAGMALVFTGVAAIFTDLALGAALVQRPTITEADRSTAFWTSLVAGLVLCSAAVALAPAVAHFFSNRAVTPLFAASSAIFLLYSLSVTQTALLTRDMNFRALEIRGIVSVVVGAAAAVPLAFAGAGAWAIVAQSLVAYGVSAMLLWRLSPWRPRFLYSLDSLRILGSFGTKTLAAQFLGYLNLNMDNVLVGRYLGSSSLGVYAIAYNVMFLPLGRISMPIQQVVFSAFSRLQEAPERLRQGWLRGNQLIAAVNVPAFLGMAVVAPDFVPVVLGHKWHAAVPVLQLLSIAGAVHSFQALNWGTLQAVGRPGVTLRLQLFSAPITIGAFAVGLRWGVVGVAGLFAVARFIVLVVHTVVTCRTIGCSVAAAFRSHLHIAALAIAMALVVYGSREGFIDAGLSAATRLVVLVVIGFAVYGPLVLWRAPQLVTELRTFVRQR
jgi:O-antigen/teichoic acid export membrane protein